MTNRPFISGLPLTLRLSTLADCRLRLSTVVDCRLRFSTLAKLRRTSQESDMCWRGSCTRDSICQLYSNISCIGPRPLCVYVQDRAYFNFRKIRLTECCTRFGSPCGFTFGAFVFNSFLFVWCSTFLVVVNKIKNAKKDAQGFTSPAGSYYEASVQLLGEWRKRFIVLVVVGLSLVETYVTLSIKLKLAHFRKSLPYVSL